MNNFRKILREFEEWRKSSPPDGYYVRVRMNEKCWITQSNKEKYISDYETVRAEFTDDISVESVVPDSGGSFFEEGEKITFSDGTQITISRPLQSNLLK